MIEAILELAQQAVSDSRERRRETLSNMIRYRTAPVRVLLFLVYLGGTFVPSPVTASEKIAKEQFQQGIALVKQRLYEEAISAFRISHNLVPKARIQYNIAMCHKALKNYPLVIIGFRHYLEEAGDAPDPDMRDQAAKEIARLEPLVGLLRITAEPAGAMLRIDDGAPRALPLGDPYPVAPGPHTVAISREGFRDFVTEVSPAAGESVSLHAVLSPVSGTIRVNCPAEGNARVSVDGVQVGRCPYEGSVPLGAHMVTVTEAGKKTFSIEVQNDDEKPVVLMVSLSPLPQSSPSPRATFAHANKKDEDAPVPKTMRDGRRSSRRVLGFTAMGIGISGLALGVAFNVKGAKDHDRMEEIYSSWDSSRGADDPDLIEYYDLKGNKRPVNIALMTAGYSVAALGVGVGVAILVIDAKRGPTPKADKRMTFTSAINGLTFGF